MGKFRLLIEYLLSQPSQFPGLLQCQGLRIVCAQPLVLGRLGFYQRRSDIPQRVVEIEGDNPNHDLFLRRALGWAES